MKTIGQMIIDARKGAGLSQMQLCEKIKVAQPTLSSWERGVYIPSGVVLQNIAKACGGELRMK